VLQTLISFTSEAKESGSSFAQTAEKVTEKKVTEGEAIGIGDGMAASSVRAGH
jgi:hypothetical protein